VRISAVDLTDGAVAEVEDEDAASTPGLAGRNPEIGFYQRRLAGLRDRLEKSGHPPQ
jgi:hypothetical protein